MIQDKWSNLLEELGKAIKVQLKPDKNNCCCLRFKTGLQLQIEVDERVENVILACDLGQLAQGRFRENVMKEALKANGLPLPHNGFFAYGKKTESLLLTDQLLLDELTGEKLAEYLVPFMQKAELWKTSIERGEVPSFMGSEMTFGTKSQAGLFGLIH
jgi:hypothetical protein